MYIISKNSELSFNNKGIDINVYCLDKKQNYKDLRVKKRKFE